MLGEEEQGWKLDAFLNLWYYFSAIGLIFTGLYSVGKELAVY